MKCKDALELLHAYFENGMDPANDKLLQKHLSSCTRCRAELEFLQKYRKNLSAIKPVKAPAGFMHRLKLKIQAENRGIFSKYYDAAMDFIRSIHVPAEAVALVLLVSIVFTLYRPDKLLTRWIDTPVTEYSENTGIHTEKIKNKSSVTDGPSSETYSSVRQKNDPARRIYPGIDDKTINIDTTTGREEEAITGSDRFKSDSAEKSDKYTGTERAENSFEKEAGEASDAYRSENRVMGKSRLDAAPEITSDQICRRYNAEIVKKEKSAAGKIEYTIEVKEDNSEALLTALRSHFNVKYKSKEMLGGRTYIILEIEP